MVRLRNCGCCLSDEQTKKPKVLEAVLLISVGLVVAIIAGYASVTIDKNAR